MKKLTLNAHRGLVALVALLVAGLLSAAPAEAAFITWGSATNTTSVTDVSTTGILIDARNEGTGSPTVNGVLFNETNDLGNVPAADFLDGGTTGDAGFDTLLSTASVGGGSGTTTIDLGTFTSGATYEVQVFFVDQRSDQNDREMTFGSDTGPDTVTLEADPNNSTTSPFGQFAIGTFVADGIDPDLTAMPNGFAQSHIMALQIRQTAAAPAVPEPSTLVLLGSAMMGLLVTRRGRRER